jgi:hypothetical protein
MLIISGGLAHPTSSRESRVSAQFTPVVEGRVLVGFAVPAENVEDVSLLPSRSRTKNVKGALPGAHCLPRRVAARGSSGISPKCAD